MLFGAKFRSGGGLFVSKSGAMSAEHAESTGSVVAKGRSYVSESIAELKKISHPTRQQTVQATLVTLVIVVFVSLCLFILDVIFGKLMQAIV